ncbi:MAG: prephenate dehydratase [Bacteroidales bacterium]|nr:prephenate dehydratase [Bacteroidales bacterium]
MKVSIQGIKGAFHEEAAKNYFKSEIEVIPNITFDDVINSVQNQKADFGIVAIENTISGTIHTNLNLIKQSSLKITGEVYLQIKQNLVALPNSKLENINQVQSHYMALNQCRDFLRKYPKIKLVESEDTALSIKQIADEQLENIGAIGSKLAAEYYGLEIISESIETNKKNYTRFLILELNTNVESGDNNKASLAITLPHKKGSLAIILNIISFYDINLTKIESVPVIGEPWHYLFYIDVQFDSTEIYLQMIQSLNPLADEIIILGEYKSGIQSFNIIHSN